MNSYVSLGVPQTPKSYNALKEIFKLIWYLERNKMHQVSLGLVEFQNKKFYTTFHQVVCYRINDYLPRSSKKSNTWHRFFYGIKIKDCVVWPLIGITRYWSYRRFQLWKKYLGPLLRNNLLLHKKGNRYLNIFKLEVTKMCFVEK